MAVRGVRVEMRMSAVILRAVDVQAARGPHAPEPERDEHHADAQLGPCRNAARDGNARPCQRRADQEYDEGVAEAPTNSEQSGVPRPRRATHERRHGDHVIHFQGMGCPEGEGRHVGGKPMAQMPNSVAEVCVLSRPACSLRVIPGLGAPGEARPGQISWPARSSQVSSTVSGLRDMLSIPSLSSHSARSG